MDEAGMERVDGGKMDWGGRGGGEGRARMAMRAGRRARVGRGGGHAAGWRAGVSGAGGRASGGEELDDSSQPG